MLIFDVVRPFGAGPVAQWKSVRFTRGRSLVRSQPGPLRHGAGRVRISAISVGSRSHPKGRKSALCRYLPADHRPTMGLALPLRAGRQRKLTQSDGDDRGRNDIGCWRHWAVLGVRRPDLFDWDPTPVAESAAKIGPRRANSQCWSDTRTAQRCRWARLHILAQPLRPAAEVTRVAGRKTVVRPVPAPVRVTRCFRGSG